MAIDTRSTGAIYGFFRARILTYDPPDGVGPVGGTLQSLGFKVHSGGYAPDAAQYPYALIRLMNGVTSDAGLRVAADLEVMSFARPRVPWGERLEDYADVIDQALLHLAARDGTGVRGFAFTRDRSRDTLPPFPAPADREVVQVRQVFSFACWPQYLTQLGTARRTA